MLIHILYLTKTMSSKINIFIYANNVSTYEKPQFSNNTKSGLHVNYLFE